MITTRLLRSGSAIKELVAEIRSIATREWTIMDICGGQMEKIVTYGLDELLTGVVHFAHGPGCPTCVTAISIVDKALFLAKQEHVIVAAFGDIMRVPGTKGMSLARARSETNAHVTEVEHPGKALLLARAHPEKEIVYFAIGFETTAAPNALALAQAANEGLRNFSMLTSQVTVPPAIRMLCDRKDNDIDAFLAAGHVCTIMGYHEYLPLAEEYAIPIVVAGFEPVDLLLALRTTIAMLEKGEHGVRNQYTRMVTREGNTVAQRYMSEMFTLVDREWNGIGIIPMSGLGIRPEFAHLDTDVRFREILEGPFREELPRSRLDPRCILDRVHMGEDPQKCPMFSTLCTPAHPIGPGMFGEGACKARYVIHQIKEEA